MRTRNEEIFNQESIIVNRSNTAQQERRSKTISLNFFYRILNK